MWTKGQYRWSFVDMHIGWTSDEYLSKTDPKKLAKQVKDAGAQTVVIKCRPWNGLAYYPTKFGEMHPTLKKMGLDYTGEMYKECKKLGLNVKAYFSQGYDDYAFDHHPEWRCINAFGKNSREAMPRFVDAAHMGPNRNGVVCLNNKEYLEYAKNCVREMIAKCHFDSIFIDMPFFPNMVCYCDSCKKKYFEETGKEMPTVIDWNDPEFRDFQYRREVWISEFVHEITRVIKETDPNCTCEHNQGCLHFPWMSASSELINDACDYVGGDTYDSYFEESFFCKYYKNISKTLPFVFIGGKCKDLTLHSTPKAPEELMRSGYIALVHNGAYSICDGINPDGTLTDIDYTGTIKEAFAGTQPYEAYVDGGEMLKNASIWFPSHSKYDRDESGARIGTTFRWLPNSKYYTAKLASAQLLALQNIPFDVVGSKNLKDLKDDLLIIASVANIRDEEMADIEKYIMNGGNVYISGKPGHDRFLELLEAEYDGDTEHWTTYMDPTEAGKKFFERFDHQGPAAAGVQAKLKFKEGSEYETLATRVLPYTLPTTNIYAAVHSDPPGVYTDEPCAVLKKVGKGQILWVASEIETAKYYNGKMVVARMLRSLIGTPKFEAKAPVPAEIMSWMKDGKQYVSVANELDDMPAMAVCGVEVTLPYEVKSVKLLNSDKKLDVSTGGGKTTIKFPVVELFDMVEVEK